MEIPDRADPVASVADLPANVSPMTSLRTLGRISGILKSTLVAAVAVATLVGASTGPANAGAEPDGPNYQQPAVGECRTLSLSEIRARADRTTPIDCADPHTTRVIKVGKLPKAMTWEASADDLLRVAFHACQPALDETLGHSAKIRDRSAYSWAWFMPTTTQRSHGARWIRCDVVLFGGKKLLTLPTDSTPALTNPLVDSVARCLTSGGVYNTTCDRAHALRATGAFTVHASRYPSPDEAREAALKRCPALVNSSSFRWSYRSKLAWNSGNHTVVCYTKTHS